MTPAESWAQRRVAVAGLGTSGQAAQARLTELGAQVTGVDDTEPGAIKSDQLDLEKIDLVVASPGWPPRTPLLAKAQAAGLPVISEVELAWRTRANRQANWLAVTGTNGKTTTVTMLAAMLQAAGRRAVAAGNVGNALVTAVADPTISDFAVELSSFQLHFTYSMQATAAVILNLAPDHIDWHGSYQAYGAAKARVYRGVTKARVFNLDDPDSCRLAAAADAGPSVLKAGFTLAQPSQGQLGLVDGFLLDRAFSQGQELAAPADLAQLAGPTGQLPAHTQANALAAAALGLAAGIGPRSLAQGLRQIGPGAHRIEEVAKLGGVVYVNDSKATNALAAATALDCFGDGQVVWIAGGQAKGARFEELVARCGAKLKAVILIGLDHRELDQALDRHAPGLPRWAVSGQQTGSVMDQAVQLAAQVAKAGDVVLLAPGCASKDQFYSYETRGRAFVQAVEALAAGAG